LKLPLLDAAAKAQLWGLLVSVGLSVLLLRRMELGLREYAIGAGLVWVIWELAAGSRLARGMHAVPAALLSGLAIPWGGFLLAWALAALRP
jgi:hypothetical protein